MENDFFECESKIIYLEETEDTGKSLLQFELLSDKSLSIKNVDKKRTEFYFFQNAKGKSMFKRVDHMVFENVSDNNWRLHLIEMKSSVGSEKWVDVKGKFRASYLLGQAICAMLEMNLVETYMYTTYEKVYFSPSETMPSARRGRVGQKNVKPEDEWNGNDFGLNFGIRVNFIHIPIQMKRDEENVLVGKYSWS